MPTPNPTTRREYKGAAASTTLTAGINASATSFTIASASGWPTGAVGNFIVTIDRGLATEERIKCSAQSAGTVTVAASGRGFDSTTAQAHANSATVECTLSAFDADEWNQHTNATTGVHGVAGAVVGTTDTQTLTNKSLTSPLVTGTWAADASGNVTGANLTNGVLNCTSATRPGAPRTGQFIYETDTNNCYQYVNGAWLRVGYGSDKNLTTFTPQAATSSTWTTSTATGRYAIVNGILDAWGYLVYASGAVGSVMSLFWNGLPLSTGIQVGTNSGGNGQIIGTWSMPRPNAGGWLLREAGLLSAAYNYNSTLPTITPTVGDVVTFHISYPVV